MVLVTHREVKVNRAAGVQECEILSTPAQLEAVRTEWTRLYQASPDAHLSDAVEWAEACLRSSPRPQGDAFCCVVVRRQGMIVAIAPFIVADGLVRIARPLACRTTEYCPFLIDPSANVASVWRAIEHQLRDGGGMDLVVLPHVRGDEGLGPFLDSREDCFVQGASPAPLLRRSAFADWSAYWAQRSRHVQSSVNRNRRRLAQLGELTFEEVTEPELRRQAWRWLFAQKQEQFTRKRLCVPALTSSDYARFIEDTLPVAASGARRTIQCLKFNGTIIAAELNNIDRRRVENFVTSFDPAYARYAPGNILRQEVVRWAFSQGLDYDCRLGDEGYKLEWASETVMARTYVLALSWAGRSYARYLKARAWCAHHAPADLRMKLRSLLPA